MPLLWLVGDVRSYSGVVIIYFGLSKKSVNNAIIINTVAMVPIARVITSFMSCEFMAYYF